MSSLLSFATPYSNGGNKKEKFTPRMTKMFEKLTTQEKPISNGSLYETEASNSISPVEKDMEIQKEKDDKIQRAISNMTNVTGFNDSDGMGNFSSDSPSSKVPVPQMPPVPQLPPVSTNQSKHEGFQNIAAFSGNNPQSNGSSYRTSYESTPYYKQLTSRMTEPMLNHSSSTSSSTVNQQQLMEKLNYMIHLLEEQQKEPTQNIMEEFFLYGLLGIFIIYLVDSFTRVGKYTR